MTTKNPADELCVIFPCSPEQAAFVEAIIAPYKEQWKEFLSLTFFTTLPERPAPGGRQ